MTTVALCECGCGLPAPISPRTHRRYGHVKGEPMRFIRGHATRGRRLTDEQRYAAGSSRRGKPMGVEHRRKISEAQVGERGNNWQGGRIVRDGRVLLYVGREHPLADVYGYAYEHRLVASGKLGRALRGDEHVHHVDLDPMNNDPGNLVVLTNAQHRRLHNRIRAGVAPYEAVCEVLS